MAKKSTRKYVRKKPLTAAQKEQQRQIALERLEKANKVKYFKKIKEFVEEAEKKYNKVPYRISKVTGQVIPKPKFRKSVFVAIVNKNLKEEGLDITYSNFKKLALKEFNKSTFSTPEENMMTQIRSHITEEQRTTLRKALAQANGVSYAKQGLNWGSWRYDVAAHAFVDPSGTVFLSLRQGRRSDESDFVEISII